MLGSEDEFFASDKDEKISWIDPDMRPKTPAVPTSRSRADSIARRRSMTLSSISNSRPSSGDWSMRSTSPVRPMPLTMLSSSSRQQQEVPWIAPPVPRRRGSSSRSRPLSLVSFATSPTRPNSISSGSSESDRRSIDTNITVPSPTREQCPCPHCHQHSGHVAFQRTSRIGPGPGAPIYVDSSVQTDPAPEPERGSGYDDADYLVKATKPVYMGVMSSYFNSGSYQLGDFFQGTYYGWIREEEKAESRFRRATI
jgi:hypothetical protein